MSDILFKPTHLPISKPFHALLANILSEHCSGTVNLVT
ncbi:hypothetical protein VCSRO51_1142 [Vibrio cholerae]|nr:hypothetical protein VCSRO51_1142 [Vibrio cholerae]